MGSDLDLRRIAFRRRRSFLRGIPPSTFRFLLLLASILASRRHRTKGPNGPDGLFSVLRGEGIVGAGLDPPRARDRGREKRTKVERARRSSTSATRASIPLRSAAKAADAFRACARASGLRDREARTAARDRNLASVRAPEEGGLRCTLRRRRVDSRQEFARYEGRSGIEGRRIDPSIPSRIVES